LRHEIISRVGQHVLHREDHHGPKLGRDAVAVLVFGEKPRQPLGRDIRLDGLGVEPLAGGRDRVGIDIRGEDLQFDVELGGRDRLAAGHRDGVCFLARAAGRDPYAQRVVGRVACDEVRQHGLGQ
jgi:hypothetical protein